MGGGSRVGALHVWKPCREQSRTGEPKVVTGVRSDEKGWVRSCSAS